MQRGADRAQEFGFGDSDLAVVADRRDKTFYQQFFREWFQRVQARPDFIQRGQRVVRRQILHGQAREDAGQAGYERARRIGGIDVASLRNDRQQLRGRRGGGAQAQSAG